VISSPYLRASSAKAGYQPHNPLTEDRALHMVAEHPDPLFTLSSADGSRINVRSGITGFMEFLYRASAYT